MGQISYHFDDSRTLQMLDARWSTFSDRFHNVSFTMQSHDHYWSLPLIFSPTNTCTSWKCCQCDILRNSVETFFFMNQSLFQNIRRKCYSSMVYNQSVFVFSCTVLFCVVVLFSFFGWREGGSIILSIILFSFSSLETVQTKFHSNYGYVCY